MSSESFIVVLLSVKCSHEDGDGTGEDGKGGEAEDGQVGFFEVVQRFFHGSSSFSISCSEATRSAALLSVPQT